MSRYRAALGARVGAVHGAARCLMAWAAGAAIATSACQRPEPTPVAAGTVTLVNRVRAAVSGLSCDTCPAAVEKALRERLAPGAITVDPGRSVAVVFEQTSSAFPSASFRSALAEGGAEALSITIEVCGSIQAAGEQAWLTSGATRLLLEGAPPATGAELCVSGELRDQVSPPRLVLGKFGG